MNNKVVLILVDGMKGDSVLSCNNEFAKSCVSSYAANLSAQSVTPSVTLPCHMSLFHSVPPERHGILSNVYVPMVRPVRSLFDCLSNHDKTSAMFYNWDELRDIVRPGRLLHSLFTEKGLDCKGDEILTDSAIDYITKKEPDFVFLYLGSTDHIGHHFGWESGEYLDAVSHSFDCVEKVLKSVPSNYTIMVTADHGGHSRGHGTDSAEDMTIPIMLMSDRFNSEVQLPSDASIIDIAPTIAGIIGIPCDKDWEGKALV